MKSGRISHVHFQSFKPVVICFSLLSQVVHCQATGNSLREGFICPKSSSQIARCSLVNWMVDFTGCYLLGVLGEPFSSWSVVWWSTAEKTTVVFLYNRKDECFFTEDVDTCVTLFWFLLHCSSFITFVCLSRDWKTVHSSGWNFARCFILSCRSLNFCISGWSKWPRCRCILLIRTQMSLLTVSISSKILRCTFIVLLVCLLLLPLSL